MVAARWRGLYATALRVRAGGDALAEELDGALRRRAAVALDLADEARGARGHPAPGPAWATALRRAAQPAADPDDTAAQSRLTALVRGGTLPPDVRSALVRATGTVRDLRALRNDRARRDGGPTVELDDDTAAAGGVRGSRDGR